MRILFVGDTPNVPTGFAACTRAACAALHAAGHTVTVLGLNEYGGPHPYPYPIYPCVHPLEGARDGFGVARLPRLVQKLHPDLVVLLNDPWNIRYYLDRLRAELPDDVTVPVVAWLAVDALNQKSAPELNDLAHVIVWTEFGATQLRENGYTGSIDICPLGVDPATFHPRECTPHERDISRARIGIPPDLRHSFIVGAVGRNQFRKRLDLTIEYFARWTQKYAVPDAILFLHTAPTGENGVDIRAYAKHYGIADRVFIASAETVGVGASVEHMAHVYSAFDVYVTTSHAEGFGLPALEAMACGVPCILPDFASFGPGGWVGDAAVRVPCSTRIPSAPMNSALYTIGAPPDRAPFVAALNDFYSSTLHRETYARRGLKLAATLPWSATGERMVGLLTAIHDRIRVESEQADAAKQAAAQQAAEDAARIAAAVETELVKREERASQR